MGDKAGQSVLCDLGSTHRSHSGYPCGHAHLAGTHTPAESQLNGRARSANHALPLLPLQTKPDAGPPARAQAANPSRYGEYRPTFHVGSSDNVSIAKPSYLANTTHFCFISFCPRNTVQIPCCPMRKQNLTIWKNALTFKSRGCLRDIRILRHRCLNPR